MEIVIDLPRGNQMLQLLQSGEATKEKHFFRHINIRKDLDAAGGHQAQRTTDIWNSGR